MDCSVEIKSQFHMICKIARSAGNSDISVNLQRTSEPQTGVRNHLECRVSTDVGTSGSWIRRASLEEITTQSNIVCSL